MNDQKKPRLSDVAKKSTTDRASRLAGAFLPPPPVAPVPAPITESEIIPVQPVAATAIVGEEQPMKTPVEQEPVPVAEPVAVTKPTAPPTTERTKEKLRRSSSVVDLTEIVGQSTPDGLRCTRMIMVCEEHHDLLRELSYKSKKPMTAILYNLLELANQALQREKKKGD